MSLTKALGGGGGSSLTVKDEGTNLSTAVTSIDFVGAGVTATGTTAVTVTIPSASGAEVLITETVLSGTSSNVSFTSIVATYRDLRVVVRGRGDKAASASCEVRMRFNGDTTATYDSQVALMNQSNDADLEARAATFILLGYLTGATGPTSQPGSVNVRVFDYRGTTFFKDVQSQNYFAGATASGGFLYNNLSGGDWRSTAAITQIDVFPDSGNFIAGTVVSLYGIL